MSIILYIPGLGPTDILKDAGRIPLHLLCANLAGENRFGGFTLHDFNVAQHSLAVAQWVQLRGGSVAEVRAALCHDLTEGVAIHDLPSPIKRTLSAYVELEGVILAQLEAAHDFDLTRYTMWREADHEILLAEQLLCQGRENVEADKEAAQIVGAVLSTFYKHSRQDIGHAMAETIQAFVPRATYDA